MFALDLSSSLDADDAVFRRIPFENLELTGANDTAGIDKLKKYAVLMFEGSSDLDKVNLDDYVVVLMYKDSDDDKVLIFTDYDIISALKEYSMVGKVKILAEVNSKKASVGSDSSRATVSTQTFVFNAEKETQASATPSQEIPPVTSFTFSSAGAPAELTGSIADILRFAAASSASSKNVSDALHKAAAAVDEQATKVGTEAESKAQQKDVNGVDKSVQHNQDDSSCPSVSTQTFIFNAEEGDKASATPSHEVPPATAFAFSSAEPSADLAGSIADILRFAAGAAVSSATSKTVTDALQKAATAVEEQAKKASATAQSKVQQAQSAVDSGVHCAVRNTERATRQAARSARQAARSVRHSVTPSAPKEDDVSQELSGGVHPAKGGDASRNSEFVAVQSHSKPETEPTPATATERLFIHGRHTCDGCLTTPIIGKRFHAVNKTDYDLCEKCFNNHNGSDMAFEEATLGKCYFVCSNQIFCRFLIVNGYYSAIVHDQIAMFHFRIAGMLVVTGCWEDVVVRTLATVHEARVSFVPMAPLCRLLHPITLRTTHLVDAMLCRTLLADVMRCHTTHPVVPIRCIRLTFLVRSMSQ